MSNMSLNEIGLDKFDDILKDRRTTSDFMWASRDWNPALAFIQYRKSDPKLIKSNTLYSLHDVITKVYITLKGLFILLLHYLI